MVPLGCPRVRVQVRVPQVSNGRVISVVSPVFTYVAREYRGIRSTFISSVVDTGSRFVLMMH